MGKIPDSKKRIIKTAFTVRCGCRFKSQLLLETVLVDLIPLQRFDTAKDRNALLAGFTLAFRDFNGDVTGGSAAAG